MANKPKRKRRTKAEIEADKLKAIKKESKGLGDKVETVLKATGIDKVVKFIAGEDCGCDERKAKLNSISAKFWTRTTPLCLNKIEYDFLTEYFSREKRKIETHSVSIKIRRIHARLFQTRVEQAGCDECDIKQYDDLKLIYEQYEK